MGKQWKQWQNLFWGLQNHEIKRRLLLGREAMTNIDSILERRIITLPKSLSSQSYGFFSSHVQLQELDHTKSWAPKKWCFQTVVLEKTLEGPLDSKEIQPVHPKGDQSWVFIGRTDAEAETPILWPSDVRVDSLEKTLMLRKIEGRRRRGWQRMRWLDCIIHSMDMGLGGLQDLVMDREACHAAVHGVTKNRTQLSDWTEPNTFSHVISSFYSRKTMFLGFLQFNFWIC